jgi:indolepyruvate ferredoxin oxidoreductase
MKSLRGTALDPFGRAEVRRVERALIPWYVDLLDRALERLTPANAFQVEAIAGLPDSIRGYEDIKLRSADLARARAAELLAALDANAGPLAG